MDRVDLVWEAPKNNGGAPITGYVIEKKEKYGSWTEAITTSVSIFWMTLHLLDVTSLFVPIPNTIGTLSKMAIAYGYNKIKHIKTHVEASYLIIDFLSLAIRRIL